MQRLPRIVLRNAFSSQQAKHGVNYAPGQRCNRVTDLADGKAETIETIPTIETSSALA
jgi:hypothetical protein